MQNHTLPDPAALSADGYIIDQARTGGIPYGALSSDINGCGWIAAYNYIRAVDAAAAPDPLDICRRLAAGSPFGCRLGTGPRRLRRFMRDQGYPLAPARRAGIQALGAGGTGGILLYLSGWEPHYVAFAPAGNGRLRFFNAQPGNPAHFDTMENFLRRFARFSITSLMVTEHED